MKVRAKTTTRLVILLTAMFVLVAGLGGAYVIRKRQVHNEYLARRSKGIAAYNAGDYHTAQLELARYTKQSQYARDHEAIFTLAEAARHNEQADGTHLVVAAGQYKRFLELQPHRDDIRRDLLRLYRQLGQFPEALTVADQILAANPKDQEAMRVKAASLSYLKRPTEALGHARAAVAKDTGNPKDFATQHLILMLYLDPRNKLEADKDPVNDDVEERRKVPAGETILKRALKLDAEYPEDGRFDLLVSYAYTMCGEIPAKQREELKALLAKTPTTRPADPLAVESPVAVDNRTAAIYYVRQAAKRPIADIDHLRLLVRQLEDLALPAETLEVVVKAESAVNDPAVRKLLIRRLFETERFGELDQRLAKMTLSAKRPDDVEALAIKGATLLRLNRKNEVPAVTQELASRPQDKVAQAWAIVLNHHLEPKDPREVAEACEEAVKVDRNNPYVRYFLGKAFEDMGERSSAIDNYREAQRLSPLWALPPRKLAQLEAAAGEPRRSLDYSIRALRLLYNDEGMIEHLRISAQAIGIEELAGHDDYVKMVARVQIGLPGEETTLPLHVQILSIRKDEAGARKALKEALSANPAHSERLLIRLATVASRIKMTDPDAMAILDVCQKQHGVTHDSAFARSLELLRRGDRDQAIASLQSAMASPPKGTELSWQFAWAQLLETIRDPRATQAWITLADNPETRTNVRVQRAALEAQSVQHEVVFLRRTTERLRAITGDRGTGWKVAQAKVHLADMARPNLPEATRLLKEVVSSSPSDAEARILLAMALQRAGDQRGAIEQASNAVKLRPDAAPVRLMLATLYSADSDFVQAREQILAIPRNRMEGEQIGQAARLLHQQGDTVDALALLETLPEAQLDASSAALQAELYRRRNQSAKAEALFVKLIDKADLAGPRELLITAYADFLAEAGKTPEARAMLARLDSLKLPPGRRDLLLAEYHLRRGDDGKAIEHYRAAVKQAPGTESAWRAIISASLRESRPADAIAEAGEALKTLPEARHFDAIVKNPDLIKAASQQPRLVPLMRSLLQSPSDAPAIVDALSVFVEAAKTREAPPDTLQKLRPIAERAPRTKVLRAMLVDGYTSIDRRDEAMQLAIRAAEASPNSVELVRMAAETLANVNEYRRALDMARRWRELSPADPFLADLFVARVHILTGELDLAFKQIEPYLKSPPADPDALRQLLAIHSLLLVRQGKFDEAFAVLRPHLARGQAWRQIWLERAIMQIKDPPAVAARLEAMEPFVPSTSLDERAILASAWYQLSASAGSDKKYRDRAAQMLDALLPQGGSSLAHFTRALINEAEGDLPAAEKGYRKALEMQPDQPFALNNLAMLILRRGGDGNEAKALAARAVASRPTIATFYDTYAQTLSAQNDHRAAIVQLKTAVKLDPRNVEWKARLAVAHGANREMIEAGHALNEVDSMLKTSKAVLPEDLRKQLQQLRDRLNGRTADAGR